MLIDWDDAFDNVGYAKGLDRLIDTWVREAETYRGTMLASGRCRRDISYGPHERHVFDLFEPEETSKGTVLFVHGGYWLRFDKSYWSHLAKGANAAGWSVAVASYPLAPEAHIAAITASIKQAVEVLAEMKPGPLRLTGHSAGGHLVSRMACSGVLPTAVAKRIERIVSISGVHDLRPLCETKMNDNLRLNEDEALAESPALQEPLAIPITFWVGAAERPEFLRQTRLITEIWSRKGKPVQNIYDPGHHHFSVIAGLSDPDSDLVRALLS